MTKAIETKTGKNGKQYFKGYITCDRCGGQGGAHAWQYTGYKCYKCNGRGVVLSSKWIEGTPEEYDARIEAEKLEARKRIEEQRKALGFDEWENKRAQQVREFLERNK